MALAPKKSVALQVRRRSSVDIAHVSGGGSADVTALSVNQASLAVTPVPSAG